MLTAFQRARPASCRALTFTGTGRAETPGGSGGDGCLGRGLAEGEGLLVLLGLQRPLHPCPIPLPDLPRKGTCVILEQCEYSQPEGGLGGSWLRSRPRAEGKQPLVEYLS